MGTLVPSELVIRTEGLDELGIKLEAPYGNRSPQHALLINNSPHHLLACEILFELRKEDGELQTARKVVAYTYPLSEKDLTKRRTLLNEEPGIAPNTKWLIAMGTDPDLVPIVDTLPQLQMDEARQKAAANWGEYKQLNIKLNAVVLENGQAFGPGTKAFLDHLNKEILE